MYRPQPRISDPFGILLRPWGELTPEDQRAADRDFLVRACADPEITRWLPVPEPYDERAAEEFIAKGHEDWRKGRGAAWAIVDPVLGTVGSIGARGPYYGRVEIGYWVDAQARGRGIASAMLTLLTDWYCNEGVRRIESVIPVANEGSIRVAERAGFEREGVLRSYRLLHGEPLDCAIYARICGGPA
jgi:RimJ/RimL family protein N-acetyltransferase